MKLFSFIVTALAIIPAALAVDQKKSAIIWFDDENTSDSIVSQVKNNILDAGGSITHTYTIIRGFAVLAPVKALQAVQALSAEHSIRVEEDEMVSTL